jgi:hypothetical protein
MAKTCAYCNFFHPTSVNVGQCRRNAPSTLVLPQTAPPGYNISGAWPGTPIYGWCGEWKAKIILPSAARDNEEERNEQPN